MNCEPVELRCDKCKQTIGTLSLLDGESLTALRIRISGKVSKHFASNQCYPYEEQIIFRYSNPPKVHKADEAFSEIEFGNIGGNDF
jgi:hypothetical protein